MVAIERQVFPTPWSEEAFLGEVRNNALAVYLVLVEENQGQEQLLAYGGLWKIFDEGHITNVAVHPGYRRRHIGEALVKVLLEEASTSGIRQFTLEARVSNEPAIRLYRKFGFREAGVRKGYYEDNNEDALIMWAEATEK